VEVLCDRLPPRYQQGLAALSELRVRLAFPYCTHLSSPGGGWAAGAAKPIEGGLRGVALPQRPMERSAAVRCSPRYEELHRVIEGLDRPSNIRGLQHGLWLRGLPVQSRLVAQAFRRVGTDPSGSSELPVREENAADPPARSAPGSPPTRRDCSLGRGLLVVGSAANGSVVSRRSRGTKAQFPGREQDGHVRVLHQRHRDQPYARFVLIGASFDGLRWTLRRDLRCGRRFDPLGSTRLRTAPNFTGRGRIFVGASR